MVFFISNKERVLSKEIIAEHLWGDDSDLLDNFDFIYVHINNLRKKLTTEGAKYINGDVKEIKHYNVYGTFEMYIILLQLQEYNHHLNSLLNILKQTQMVH